MSGHLFSDADDDPNDYTYKKNILILLVVYVKLFLIQNCITKI